MCAKPFDAPAPRTTAIFAGFSEGLISFGAQETASNDIAARRMKIYLFIFPILILLKQFPACFIFTDSLLQPPENIVIKIAVYRHATLYFAGLSS